MPLRTDEYPGLDGPFSLLSLDEVLDAACLLIAYGGAPACIFLRALVRPSLTCAVMSTGDRLIPGTAPDARSSAESGTDGSADGSANSRADYGSPSSAAPDSPAADTGLSTDEEPGDRLAADAKSLVRAGYNALSELYDAAYGSDTKYEPWLTDLLGRIPAGAAVLDIGSGSGVPVARRLTDAGCSVIGVDISDTQVLRAREQVPGATFLRADAADPQQVSFPDCSFDAVVSFYALIHVPLDEQAPLLRRIAAWLRPGGWFVGTMGHRAWTGTEPEWLGGGTPMWWSHADAATNRAWLTDAGLDVVDEEFVPEGSGGAALFRARRLL